MDTVNDLTFTYIYGHFRTPERSEFSTKSSHRHLFRSPTKYLDFRGHTMYLNFRGHAMYLDFIGHTMYLNFRGHTMYFIFRGPTL